MPDLWENESLAIRQSMNGRVTLYDKKGRATRRRPYWIDVGKGPEGKRCKDCLCLIKTQYSKTYYKCRLYAITNGPGTQIATTDPACSRFMRKGGLSMFTIKAD